MSSEKKQHNSTPDDEHEIESPYIEQCARCGNGLLRIYRCDSCESIVAMCDECELIWSDIEAVSKDPQIESSGMFPRCPSFDSVADWTRLESEDATTAGLSKFVKGTSP